MGKVTDVRIEKSLEAAYMAYAIAVNLGRSIPDLRDGLKPVQRRVILGLVNLTANNDKFIKSARVVGEVMGKYHPHGDKSIYDAAISMSTDWGNRLPLIIPQGNNGSISGDNPAAMRYTEMKLSKHINVNKHKLITSGVPVAETYDGSNEEYTLLPTDIPYILVNGTRGIGVSISTYIPPFNPKEIARACKYILNKWMHNKTPTVKGIAKYITGPDFPTGGAASSPDWYKVLNTGKGKITHEVIVRYESNVMHIYSTPTETTVTQLVQSIHGKVKELGIKDMTDLTDGKGVDIELVYKKDITKDMVEALYVNTLARVNKTVKMVVCFRAGVVPMNVLEILEKWLQNRDINYLSTIFNEHKVLLDKVHNLNLMIFIARNIDAIVKIIQGSEDGYEARGELISKLDVDECDADKILLIQLSKVRSLDVKVRQHAVKGLKSNISLLEKKMVTMGLRYKDILSSMENLIVGEEKRLTNIVEYRNVNIRGNMSILMHMDVKFIMAREAIAGEKNVGFKHIIRGDRHILILSSEGILYRIPVSKISGEYTSPIAYINTRRVDVSILYVGAYIKGMSLKITLYNGSITETVPDNIVVGKKGNKLFKFHTKVNRVKAIFK